MERCYIPKGNTGNPAVEIVLDITKSIQNSWCHISRCRGPAVAKCEVPQTSGLICVLGSSCRLSISYKLLCSESEIFSGLPSISGTSAVVRGGAGRRWWEGDLGRNLSCHIYDNFLKCYFFFLCVLASDSYEVKVRTISSFSFPFSFPPPSFLPSLSYLPPLLCPCLPCSTPSFPPRLHPKAQLGYLISSQLPTVDDCGRAAVAVGHFLSPGLLCIY